MKTSKYYVQKMLQIDWSKTSDNNKLFLSAITALEFAQSQRLANMVHPNNKGVQAMSAEELMTDNLRFGSYTETGDHVDFLLSELSSKEIIFSIEKTLLVAGLKYLSAVGKFTPAERAMTVFSRERELPNIFKNLLLFPMGDKYNFYKYYLKQHILLDSQDGGHADMISDMELDEEVLKRYYEIRFRFYQTAF